jgi:hypothetical protein
MQPLRNGVISLVDSLDTILRRNHNVLVACVTAGVVI